MAGASRLGLGTAQFGQVYGITNRLGWIAADEVGRILRTAAEVGVSLLDTAAADSAAGADSAAAQRAAG